MFKDRARNLVMPQRPPAYRKLADEGYVILREALPAPMIKALSADLDARFEATPFCQGSFYGAHTKRFGRLLIRSPHMAALIMHPTFWRSPKRRLGAGAIVCSSTLPRRLLFTLARSRNFRIATRTCMGARRARPNI